MNKVILVAAVFLLAPLHALSQEADPVSKDGDSAYVAREGDRSNDILDRLSKSELKDRLVGAIQTIKGACAADVESFCGNVTRGEGRLALCMQAYEDQLSRGCQSALYRVSSNFERAVENMTNECWDGIKAQCGDAEKIGQCVVQKSASLSHPCQAIVAALQQTAQGLAHLRGMPVYSSDDKNLGQIVQVERSPDGKIQSIQVQIGRFLGLGDKVVKIDGNKLEQLADRIKLRLNGDEVRSLPEAKNAS